MLPHGPDATAFEHASNVELKPAKLEGTMAFMFETRFPQRVTRYAAELRAAAGGLRRLLGRAEEALRSGQAQGVVTVTCSPQRACAQARRILARACAP